MLAQINHTKYLHELITQIDCTRQDDVTAKNGILEQYFQMLQSNSGAYGGSETG